VVCNLVFGFSGFWILSLNRLKSALRGMVFEPMLVETKEPEFPSFKIEYTRFIGLFSCIITSLLKAEVSIVRKLNKLSLQVYYITYFFSKFGSIRK
jgi:hypothetical protein